MPLQRALTGKPVRCLLAHFLVKRERPNDPPLASSEAFAQPMACAESQKNATTRQVTRQPAVAFSHSRAFPLLPLLIASSKRAAIPHFLGLERFGIDPGTRTALRRHHLN